MKMRKTLAIVIGLVAIEAYAGDIVVSWESNGVLRATGMMPGSTCTVEWASSLEGSFTNSPTVYQGLLTDTNGTISMQIPMYFRVTGIPENQWITNGLIAYYPFDGDAQDYSGNGNHGIESNGVSYVASLHGQAASFDGIDDYIDIDQLLYSDDNATISFYACSSGDQNNYAVMVSQGHRETTAMSGFVFQYGYPAGSDSVFLFGKKIGAINSWKHLSYPIDLELDLNWHHYVMTKSGNEVTIYFDGSLIESSADGINFGTYRLNIGRDFYNADNNHRSFNGKIDELRIYNKALSLSEIQQL